MNFQFDTTGHIDTPPGGWGRTATVRTRWDDLDAFTQGYIEALFAEWGESLTEVGEVKMSWPRGMTRVAFSDLAPETLARIIADCAKERARADSGPDTKGAGAAFWAGRNTLTMTNEYHKTGFPPLTVQLGDDGKVRFA